MGELLAKPDKSLIDHLLEVYEIGKILVKELELEDDVAKRALLACLMHDVGKATESFQKYIRGEIKKSYPHALASVPFVLIAEKILFGEPYAATGTVLSHHSPLSGWMYEGWPAPKYREELKELLKEIFSVCKDFQVDGETVYTQGLVFENPSNLIHAGTKALLRKIQKIPSDIYAPVKAVLHLADWLASGNMGDPSLIFLRNGSERLSNFINGRFELWNFQKEASEVRGKDLRLRAPTGSGKTEALLLWAGDAKRIVYLLPTQATANAMWMRLSKIYGDENVGIAHGRASYVMTKRWQENQAEEPPLNYRLFASVFAKPVVVATLDQFLMGFMKGRHWEERQTLSKKSAIIIDEIHSYEPFTLGILKYILENGVDGRVATFSANPPPPPP